jgi:hypothetical protein
VRAEITGTIGLAGFDVLRQGESDASRGEGGSGGEKMQFAGSKGWWLVYTEPCWGIQNGNSS